MDIRNERDQRNGRVIYLDDAAGQLVEYQTTQDVRQYILDGKGLVIGWDMVARPPRGHGWECAVRTPDHRRIWTRTTMAPSYEMAVA